jgi:hypothetical protein
MTRKALEANEDWIKRDEGRIPTKGAQAAERASAGLGVTDDDDHPFTRDPYGRARVRNSPELRKR